MNLPNFFDVMLEATRDGGFFVFLFSFIFGMPFLWIFNKKWIKKVELSGRKTFDGSNYIKSITIYSIILALVFVISLYLPTILKLIILKKWFVYYPAQLLLGISINIWGYYKAKRDRYYQDTREPILSSR